MSPMRFALPAEAGSASFRRASASARIVVASLQRAAVLFLGRGAVRVSRRRSSAVDPLDRAGATNGKEA